MSTSRVYRSATRPLLILLLAIGGGGCDAAEPEDLIPSDVTVIVANQGNFSDGNGSITRYDPESKEVATVLGQANSIIQSLTLKGGLMYVAMNTGNRIDVIDAAGGLVGQVLDVPSPRYLAWADTDRLLVSNLFDNTVSVIDMTSSAVVDRIDVGSNPEGVSVHRGSAYVANHGFGAGNTITVIEAATNRAVRTLQVDCDGPRFVYFDDEDEMWTLCTGQILYDQEFNVLGTTNGSVLIVDPMTGTVQNRFDLEDMAVTAGPGQDAYHSKEAQSLFVVVGGDRIARFDMSQNRRLPDFGPLDGPPIGAVAFDPVDQQLYVGRVPGFAESGQVTILQTDGTSVSQFSAGVAPSHIEILRDEGGDP